MFVYKFSYLINLIKVFFSCYVDCFPMIDSQRVWSATTATAQLEETNQQLRDSLSLSVNLRFPRQSIMPPRNKEVFLRHIGKQKNFVRQLHRDLTREHVSSSLMKMTITCKLPTSFLPFIIDAVETCKIAIVVSSKEFIRSK